MKDKDRYLERERKKLREEGLELTKEHARLTKESKAIDKICESLDTGKAITKLLTITEKEQTPELFKKAQQLLSFFRRHRRYSEDAHVYATRLRKYEVALAKNQTARSFLKEGDADE